MKYKGIPITERIQRLKETYRHLPVPMEDNPYIDKKYKGFCTGDRWMTLGYLRGWQKHADAETTRLRTSYAEAEELYEALPVIFPDELLLGHLYLPEYSEAEQAEYEKLCEMFQMSSHTLKERAPRKDHLTLDFEKLLKKGIAGIRREILEASKKLDIDNANAYPEYSDIKKEEFYQCLLIELDAVTDLARRYAEVARHMAETMQEPRKKELLKMAEIIERVPENPAESFYEAVQSVQFLLSGLFGLYPLGRPDRYLYPYYKKDVENGVLTKEFAQELVDNFCLCISDRVFSRAACGFIVGGQEADGTLVENDLTYMFLTALDHLHLPDPNGALAVNRNTSTEILTYCAEILAKGTTHPAFYNDEIIINSLVQNYGCVREDAVQYIHSTCAEMSIAGKTRSHTTPIVLDMPRILQETAEKYTDCGSLETLLSHYTVALKTVLKKEAQAYILRMLEASRIGNEAMRVCAFIDDCIAKGKSIYEGGERYTFIQPIFIGFATVVDSLYAVRELVFRQKKLSLGTFVEITKKNFEGNEKLQQYIIHKLPHYGNDCPEIDALAKTVAAEILSIFKEKDLAGGSFMMPGTFSYINHALYGKEMGATFDGRKSGTSYSDGCCPVQGRDMNGPTAMLSSLTSWDESLLLGGMVVNIKFGTDNLKGEKTQNFIGLLRAFVERGGIEMQVNVVDRNTLQDAMEHPNKHSNLIVRIGGYSDYFIRLMPVLQKEIIERTEY